jgi:hypothetical protein
VSESIAFVLFAEVRDKNGEDPEFFIPLTVFFLKTDYGTCLTR